MRTYGSLETRSAANDYEAARKVCDGDKRTFHRQILAADNGDNELAPRGVIVAHLKGQVVNIVCAVDSSGHAAQQLLWLGMGLCRAWEGAGPSLRSTN